jgi:hypothetical protein
MNSLRINIMRINGIIYCKAVGDGSDVDYGINDEIAISQLR